MRFLGIAGIPELWYYNAIATGASTEAGRSPQHQRFGP
jgi:hypothetical protein